jgi:hypothetical protein
MGEKGNKGGGRVRGNVHSRVEIVASDDIGEFAD